MKPLFDLGMVLGTPGALAALDDSGERPETYLDRHVTGDWGAELCPEDRLLNDEAVKDGTRILSAYKTIKGVKFWIITESKGDDGQREATTFLLPEEY